MDISENSALWKCEYKNFVIKCVDGFQEIFSVALDFKRSPCSERCILSLEWFRGFWILLSAFKNTVFHIHRRCKHSSCYHRIWSWNSVPKRRHKIQTPGNHPKERIQQSVVLLPNVMKLEQCSETSAQNSDAGESPKRKNTTNSGAFTQRYPVSYSDWHNTS